MEIVTVKTSRMWASQVTKESEVSGLSFLIVGFIGVSSACKAVNPPQRDKERRPPL